MNAGVGEGGPVKPTGKRITKIFQFPKQILEYQYFIGKGHRLYRMQLSLELHCHGWTDGWNVLRSSRLLAVKIPKNLHPFVDMKLSTVFIMKSLIWNVSLPCHEVVVGVGGCQRASERV